MADFIENQRVSVNHEDHVPFIHFPRTQLDPIQGKSLSKCILEAEFIPIQQFGIFDAFDDDASDD